jgi:hypothetical protein
MEVVDENASMEVVDENASLREQLVDSKNDLRALSKS